MRTLPHRERLHLPKLAPVRLFNRSARGVAVQQVDVDEEVFGCGFGEHLSAGFFDRRGVEGLVAVDLVRTAALRKLAHREGLATNTED